METFVVFRDIAGMFVPIWPEDASLNEPFNRIVPKDDAIAAMKQLVKEYKEKGKTNSKTCRPARFQVRRVVLPETPGLCWDWESTVIGELR